MCVRVQDRVDGKGRTYTEHPECIAEPGVAYCDVAEDLVAFEVALEEGAVDLF